MKENNFDLSYQIDWVLIVLIIGIIYNLHHKQSSLKHYQIFICTLLCKQNCNTQLVFDDVCINLSTINILIIHIHYVIKIIKVILHLQFTINIILSAQLISC